MDILNEYEMNHNNRILEIKEYHILASIIIGCLVVIILVFLLLRTTQKDKGIFILEGK